VSYETLASKLASARIDKSSRFTDWARRPLSERQLAYALSDVTHLRLAYEKLRKRIDKAGRHSWFEDEMAVLTEPRTYQADPRNMWRRLKVRSDKPRFLALLRELAAWREEEAQRRNLPRNRVIKDESLIELAAHAPRNVEDLSHGRGLGRGFAESKQGTAILAAIERGMAVPESESPKPDPRPVLPAGIGPLVELLKVLLKSKCEQHGVAQRLIASSDDLDLLAADDSADIPALHGWRRDVFGEDALALKAGRIGLAVAGKGIKIIPLPPAA
jgi:ribonuclease D